MLRRNSIPLSVETPLAPFIPNTSSQYYDSSTCKTRQYSGIRIYGPVARWKISLEAGLKVVLTQTLETPIFRVQGGRYCLKEVRLETLHTDTLVGGSNRGTDDAGPAIDLRQWRHDISEKSILTKNSSRSFHGIYYSLTHRHPIFIYIADINKSESLFISDFANNATFMMFHRKTEQNTASSWYVLHQKS